MMRTYLANIDWNNLLKNKTATECWTCLKYEKKKTREKVAQKQMLWRVYKHTGNVEDYTNYKEALNLATT